MMRLDRMFPLLLLAVLAGLTFWLNETLQQDSRVAETVRHDPDYIVTNIVAHRMDVNGDIKHTLYADRMVHYPDDDTTDLTSPRLVSNTAGGPPMTITSKTATVSSGGEHVFFNTDVRATRAAHGNRSAMVLETSFLQVTPDEHIARTDRPVTITDAHTVAHAVGLELNSETRITRFLSEFKGTYHDPGRTAKRR